MLKPIIVGGNLMFADAYRLVKKPQRYINIYTVHCLVHSITLNVAIAFQNARFNRRFPPIIS
jgi:hypothetical protein